jgi:predicted anti-sigma-YlaC factor YlaD
MDCDVIRGELVGFHFGEIDGEPRVRVEAHLSSCPACLQAFLTLKRAIETTEAKPSPAAAARLREAVAREVRSRRPAAWSWWQRPLAVAIAAAAVLLATSTVHVLASSAGGAPRGWSTPER